MNRKGRSFLHFSGILLLSQVFVLTASARGGIICEDPVFDFGTVQSGESISHVFVLRNTGDKAVTITDIDAPCDCTRAVVANPLLPAGASTELEAFLDLQGRIGTQNRRIYVRVDNELEPSLTLALRGHASEGLRISPAILVLRANQAQNEGAWQGVVSVEAPDGAPISITATDPGSVDWEISPRPGVETAQPKLELLVRRLSAPPPGQEKTIMRIHTNHPDYANAEFQVITIADAGLVFAPSSIELTEAMGTQEKRSILIRDPAGGDLDVLHVELPQGGMSWEIGSGGSATGAAPGFLRVDIDGIHPVETLDGEVLRIHLTGPGNRTVEVPFKVRR